MRLLDILRFRFRALFHADDVEQDIDREMAFHVEMEAARLVADGVPTHEALRLARVSFGGRQRFREETRDEIQLRGVGELGRDLRYAARTLRRTPAFALTVVATVALGIGATTVVFSVTDHIVLRPLPYANADRLMNVQILSDRLKNVSPTWSPNAAHYLAWKAGCTLCEEVIALRPTSLLLTSDADPALLPTLRISDNVFAALGARPEIGRLFAPGDDRPGNERLAVISDALWRQRFGASPDVIGRVVTLTGVPWTIIGVLSPESHMLRGKELGGFVQLPTRTDVFIPLALSAHERKTGGEFDYGVLALVRPGVTPAALRAQLNAVSTDNAAALHDDTPSRVLADPLKTQVVGAAGRPLLLLLAAVAAMLLIMCVNLANLFLARSVTKRREWAVRVALGASHGRLVRQALTETVLLSCIGGAIGVLLSRWGVRVLVALAPSDLPRLNEVQVDARVLLVAILVSVAAGLTFGFVPALRLSRTAPGSVLQANSRAATSGPEAARARGWLIGSQVGLSAVLLISAGLFLKSFVRVLHADRGFTAERVLALNVTLPMSTYGTGVLRTAFYDEALRRIGALPGVSAAGLANGLPLEGETWVESIWTESDAGTRGRDFDSNFRFISPNYFALLGVPILRGRAFTESDRGANRVVLSENAARALWPDENAVGKYARLGGTDSVYEVIGVVPNVRTTGIEREGSLTAYTPHWERGAASTILVRTTGDPASLVTSVRGAIRAIAPAAPISKVRTIGQIISGLVAQRRFEAALIGAFALAALLTASIGIYGIISHSLTQRANEIGIRIALGAVPRQIHALVLGEVLRPVGVGLLAGVVGSLLIGRAIASLLFEVRPSDGVTLASVVLMLVVTAALAAWIPARRATQRDFVGALRGS
jgi:predicted permease